MKAFLEPLTKQEEQLYINRMKQGDLVARNILIERNMRLVAHIAKKFQSSEADKEDLISIGAVGLMKGVMTYDDTKGSRLATYSARCIENEMLMYMRAKKKTAKDISLYEQIGTDKEGNHLRLMDVIDSGENDMTHNIEVMDALDKIKNNMSKLLTPREYVVIQKRYGLDGAEECTQMQIAKQLNISRSYVSRIEKKALKKLRAFLAPSE